MKQLEYLKKLIKNGNSDLLTDFLYEDFDATTMLLQELIKVPTADEIVKELNKLDGYECWRYVNNEFLNDIGEMIFIDYGTFECELDLPLKLAHKITSFFMAKEK